MHQHPKSMRGLALLLLLCASISHADSMPSEYQAMCRDCHGTASTPSFAPSLFGTSLDERAFSDVVRDGRRAMPAFPTDALSDSRLRALFQSLKSTPSADTPPPEPVPEETPPHRNTRRPTTIPGVQGAHVDAATAQRLRNTQRSPADIYRQECERCHRDLNGPLPGSPLDQRYFIPELRFMTMSQPAFIRVVQSGAGAMPPFPHLPEDQLKTLFRWIKDFKPAKTSAVCRADSIQETHRRWGQQLYLAHCARCHGETGQGTTGVAGRIDTPPFNQAAPHGVIWQKANAGHKIAPGLPFLSYSDKHQIAVYLREMRDWQQYGRDKTPATFRELNGADCQRQLCTRYAHAADEKVNANSNPGLLPNAGSLECQQYQRKNRKKGPAGPGSIYPDCWAQQEVDTFEAFCEAYQPGISARYPKPPEVQAVTNQNYAQANTQLRPVWSEQRAQLTCRYDASFLEHIGTPDPKHRPNWQIRLYTKFVEPGSVGGCWWTNPEQGLGAGNPLPDEKRRDRITLLVRLPERGEVPARQYAGTRLGVADLDQPDHGRPANVIPFYQVMRVVHAKTGEFTLPVYRNIEHDRTRKPNACGACGNSEFSNEQWSIDR